MSELITIFKKIEDNFNKRYQQTDQKSKYDLIFSPLSMGFYYEDFLFLDSRMASEKALKYVDEQIEFSRIANTIPRQLNFWTLSGEKQDYLFTPYKRIVDGLRLFDKESLTPEKVGTLYEHSVFDKALQQVDEENKGKYLPFFKLFNKYKSEIKKLKDSLTGENKATAELEIKLKEENLNKIITEWIEKGQKKQVESEIIAIIKDEFDHFMDEFKAIKSSLLTLKRTDIATGATYYLTGCTPNNLYTGEHLEWKNIKMDKKEINALFKSIDRDDYGDFFKDADISRLEIEEINFDLLFVNVTRAWYNPLLLTSPFWDIHILEPEEIAIPRYTNKLIFIRNVSIKLPEKSETNKRILGQVHFQNIGPFILNAKQLKQGQRVQLKSINSALKINRNLVYNVSANINRKKSKQAIKIKPLISKKMNQFVRLAPQLKRKFPPKHKKKPVKLTINPKIKIATRFIKMPLFHKATLSTSKTIKVRLKFQDASTHEFIPVSEDEIIVSLENKPVRINFTPDDVEVSGTFDRGKTYTLKITHEGYEPLSVTIKTPAEGNKELTKTCLLSEIESSFQLIGVVTREVGKFPNPIKGVEYI